MGYLDSSEKKGVIVSKILIDFHSDIKQAVGMCIRLHNDHKKNLLPNRQKVKYRG